MVQHLPLQGISAHMLARTHARSRSTVGRHVNSFETHGGPRSGVSLVRKGFRGEISDEGARRPRGEL